MRTDSISKENNNSILSFIPAFISSALNRAPDLTVEYTRVSDSTLTPGQKFQAYFKVKNQGGVSYISTTVRYYVSTDTTISQADTQLSTDTLPSLWINDISFGSKTIFSPTSTGIYWIGACVDPVNKESDTGNNCSTGVKINVAFPPPNLLFEDQFDTFPNPFWNPVGTNTQDYSKGTPSSPSLRINSVTSVPTWSSEEGLNIYMSISADDDSTCTPLEGIPQDPITSGSSFSIYDVLGHWVGGLGIGRDPYTCKTSISYWIEAKSSGETIDYGFSKGQFWTFNFRIFPNGDVQWLRDGYIKNTSFPSSPIKHSYFYVRLTSSPTVGLNFDNFQVFNMQ